LFEQLLVVKTAVVQSLRILTYDYGAQFSAERGILS